MADQRDGRSRCPASTSRSSCTSPAAPTPAARPGSPTSASKARRSRRTANWSTPSTSASAEPSASTPASRARSAIAPRPKTAPKPSSACSAAISRCATPREDLRAYFARTPDETLREHLAGAVVAPVAARPRSRSVPADLPAAASDLHAHPEPVMSLFPIFLKLTGRPCVVIGAGNAGRVEDRVPAGRQRPRHRDRAARRANASSPWRKRARSPGIQREYAHGDLAGQFLAVAATDVPAVNRAVFAEAEASGVLINAVDDPPFCDFYFPSVVRRGDLQIAISTAGASPALATASAQGDQCPASARRGRVAGRTRQSPPRGAAARTSERARARNSCISSPAARYAAMTAARRGRWREHTH